MQSTVEERIAAAPGYAAWSRWRGSAELFLKTIRRR